MHWGPCTSPRLTIGRAGRVESPSRCHSYVASHLSEQDSKKAREAIFRGVRDIHPACRHKEPPAEHADCYVPPWPAVTISDDSIARVEAAENINPGYILAGEQQQPENPACTQRGGKRRLVKLKRECHQVVNTSCQEGSTSLILEQPSHSLYFPPHNCR